jgi:hypothetical protein
MHCFSLKIVGGFIVKILGILVMLYAMVFVVIAVVKPGVVWNSKKTETLKKVFGEIGTGIFFYIWALLILALGIWLFTK